MKIIKKHAVTLTHFVVDYLENGYYPVDDDIDESAILSRVLSFGLHHDIIDTTFTDYWVKKRQLPKCKKVARIDLTSDESCAIMDMAAESIGKDIEDNPQRKQMRDYLNKEFILKGES